MGRPFLPTPQWPNSDKTGILAHLSTHLAYQLFMMQFSDLNNFVCKASDCSDDILWSRLFAYQLGQLENGLSSSHSVLTSISSSSISGVHSNSRLHNIKLWLTSRKLFRNCNITLQFQNGHIAKSDWERSDWDNIQELKTVFQLVGYTTWFTAGGAIRIAQYDVIDDVITRKL